LPAFVAKAFNESQGGLEVVCILPYYKSYPWFRDFVWAYAEVRQIQGHVVFDGFGPKAKKHAGNIAGPQSFDSIVAIFRPGQKGFSGPYIDRPGSRSASPSEPGLLEGLQEVLDSAKQNQTSKETLVGRGETEECDEQAASKAEQSRESLREQYGPEYYDYATPDWLRKAIERDYGFPALDVAASHGKQFGKVWYTPEQDGLRQEWYRDAKGGLIWANPPYGSKTLGEWVKKGYQASQQGATVLMLLPLWRKYDWFSAYVVKYAEVRFATVPVVSVGFGPMTGRKCGNTNWYSEYESILAIFRKGQEGFLGEWIRP